MILLLTHSGDFYTIDRVKMALDTQGVANTVIHTDRYPQFLSLSTGFQSDSQGKPGMNGYTAMMVDQSGPIDLSHVTAVWNRRIWPGLMPADLPPAAVAHNGEVCKHTFNETLALLDHAYWMNPLHSGFRSESKSLQLKHAAMIGMRIPETLISNDPEKIESFFHRHDGILITKTLLPMATSMEAAPDFAYTCRVTTEHLKMLDVARLSPQIYQPLIEKKWELRVVVVEQNFFVAGIRGHGGQSLGLDWRTPDHGEIEWFEAAFPDSSRDKLLTLMKRLGIVFGAVDFIVDDPEREPVFLEINQAGEWGMLERDLNFPIAETIASSLAEHGK